MNAELHTPCTVLALATVLLAGADPASAHDISADKGGAAAPYDIVQARVTAEDHSLVFEIEVVGEAGAQRPEAHGALGGAPVHAYVWPTSLDPAAVGFEAQSGMLALAVTAHPDFDDTPWFDEDGDGDRGNDGRLWHSHWVVLVPGENCPADGALRVRDIPDGATPALPATWPGLPIFIDSPGYTPLLDAGRIEVRVPFSRRVELDGAAYDAVAAGLRVNGNVHDPLLCVEDVWDIASGDLSLPGRVTR